MARAFRAQGELETIGHAIERKRPVGEYLKDRDPFFAYPAVEYEAGFELPGHPGAVMSVFSSEGGLIERIDAVPRDNDAMERYGPEVTFSFTDEAGAGPLGRRDDRAERPLAGNRDDEPGAARLATGRLGRGCAGNYAGLTLTVLIAWRGDYGEQRFDWRREASSAPAADQGRALRFIAAMHDPGDFVLRPRRGPRGAPVPRRHRGRGAHARAA